MRFLLRQLLSEPKLLFGGSAILAIALAVIAFIWSERRARRLAELSDDPSLARGQQRRRLAVVGTLTIAVIAGAGWWSLVRVATDPRRVMVAVAVETPDGSKHWWNADPGALALSEQLAERLEAVGFESIGFEAELMAELLEAGTTTDTLEQTAREHEARWLVRGRVRTDKQIALELAESHDYLLDVEIELVDTETGEVVALPSPPVRALLWGDDPSDAVWRNRDYLVDRVTMPLIATLGGHPVLREYTGETVGMSSEDALIATALKKLFLRADNYAEGLEFRTRDEATARDREPENHAEGTHTRVSEILAEEYVIGTAGDGRVLLLSSPKYVSVVPDRLGYVISSEAEELVLADPDGDSREVLFEHYNFYSAPAISADGRIVWTTVANHGESKTLATLDIGTGTFSPVLSHQTDYYTSPIPAPDGARALFYSRAGRYAETSIELIAADGSGRKSLISADQLGGVPAWAPDGSTIYAPIGAWQRLVAIDPETGATRHLLGQDPDAPPAEPEEPNDDEVETPPDPRFGPDLAHHGAPAVTLGDPATTSRFTAIAVGHDGSYLFVVEQSLDGRNWLGRLDLVVLAEARAKPTVEPTAEPTEADESPKPYTRLAQMEIGSIQASPTGSMLAFEAPAFTASGDPDNQDREVLVFGPDPGQLRAVTLNVVDDELGGWSRDGRSVFTVQRARDPGDDSAPVVRVYRHELAGQ